MREVLFCDNNIFTVYASFIGYINIFDCIQHQKMIEFLKSHGIYRKDICIIIELYWNQVSEVRVRKETPGAKLKRK